MTTVWQRRTAAGLCGIQGCTNQPLPGHKLCPKHRQQTSGTNNRGHAARLAAGLCKRRTCPNRAAPDCVHCGKHKLAAAVAAQARRARNVAAGLCSSAASHGPPAPGHRLCPACLARSRRRAAGKA